MDAMEIRLLEVMRSLQGMTYLQWRKIATAVDASPALAGMEYVMAGRLFRASSFLGEKC